jgi:hypothetical protein
VRALNAAYGLLPLCSHTSGTTVSGTLMMGLRECFTRQGRRQRVADGADEKSPAIRVTVGIHVSIANRLIMHSCMNLWSIYEYLVGRTNYCTLLPRNISQLFILGASKKSCDARLKLFYAIYFIVLQDLHVVL